MKYGKAVRVIRAAMGLSQKEIALRAGINPSYLSLLEKEARSPSTETVRSLANALNVPPHLLALLASEEADLAGLKEEEADVLGRQLLDLLLSSPAEI